MGSIMGSQKSMGSDYGSNISDNWKQFFFVLLAFPPTVVHKLKGIT
jgi:hypothetical protein